MRVQFSGVAEWQGQTKTVDLPSVPQVGDSVELVEDDTGTVRTVVWCLAGDEPWAYVVFGRARP